MTEIGYAHQPEKPKVVWKESSERMRWSELPEDPYHEPYEDAWDERLHFWSDKIQLKGQGLPIPSYKEWKADLELRVQPKSIKSPLNLPKRNIQWPH